MDVSLEGGLPCCSELCPFLSSPRLADCPEIHHEGHGASPPDRPAALFCHPHVCHHWPGVLQWEAAPSLLHKQFRWGRGLGTPSTSGGKLGRAAPHLCPLWLCAVCPQVNWRSWTPPIPAGCRVAPRATSVGSGSVPMTGSRSSTTSSSLC